MNLLYSDFLFPLIGFLLLAFSRGRWSENPRHCRRRLYRPGGVWSRFMWIWQFNVPPADRRVSCLSKALWNWMAVGNFNIGCRPCTLDGLSLTMLSVVTGVGFFIHLFASWYMRGEEGYSRFFAYTNLFIASMVFLVLGDNLLLLYFGWEGVGLCSYLLIGFYYKQPPTVRGDESLHRDPRR